jgi:carbon-monoxide dehydrogenase medium subunit
LIPYPFEYVAPKSIPEAVRLLSAIGEGAKVLAGGQSLIPLLKLRLASPQVLVDITRIPGLDYIRESEGQLRLGALTRISEVASSSLIQKRYAIIHDASKVIADPIVRNLGTVGGNISHGDPANDLPAVMFALGAEFVATGSSGERVFRAQDFYLDTFATALRQDEILTEVRVPKTKPRSGGAYLKHEQKVGDFATAGVAVQLTINSRGLCESAGIGLTAVGPTAIKAVYAEKALTGIDPGDEPAVEEASRLAANASDPASDIRGTADYKRGLVKTLVARGVRTAHRRSKLGGSS